VKRKSPISIIQDGKKGIRGLIIVFIEIRAVTGFAGEIGRGESGQFQPIIAGIK
jgi:hypothetical protein